MSDTEFRFAEEETMHSPQLLFYPERIRENIRQMVRIANGPDRLWPHIKTYKTGPVLQLLIDAGITRCKCATMREAELAAGMGMQDIVIAYPLVGPLQRDFMVLREAFPNSRFYAIADDLQVASALGALAPKDNPVLLLLDTDLGLHRTGVPLERVEMLYPRFDALSGIRLCGLHCYDGDHTHSLEERNRRFKETDRRISMIAASLWEQGFDCSTVILGGTPSFPCHVQFSSFYVSPGTCVIQDAGYGTDFPDLPFTPAAAILTRIISRPAEDRFTIDLGTKAVASDPFPARAVLPGMPFAVLCLHSEEHMTFQVPSKHIKDIPPIGSILFAIPWHVCPTSILYPEIGIIESGHFAGWWDVDARDRFLTF